MKLYEKIRETLEHPDLNVPHGSNMIRAIETKGDLVRAYKRALTMGGIRQFDTPKCLEEEDEEC